MKINQNGNVPKRINKLRRKNCDRKKIRIPYMFGIEIKLSNGDVLQVDNDGHLWGDITGKTLFDKLPSAFTEVHLEMEKRLKDFFKNNYEFEVDRHSGVKFLIKNVVSYELY